MLHQFFSIATGLHAVDFAANTKAKTSSGSSAFFYVLLLLIIVAYFFWFRPQRQRMRKQQVDQRQFEIGDEVITTGGIIGRIVANDGSRIDLEISPGTVIQVVSQAIARRTEQSGPVDDHDHNDHDHDHDHGDFDEHETGEPGGVS